jgi:hypothetical protein
VFDTAPIGVQLEPPLVLYCHTPFESSMAVTAIPATAPASASVTWPAMRAETSDPVFEASAMLALIVVRLLAPLRTGARFCVLTVLKVPIVE